MPPLSHTTFAARTFGLDLSPPGEPEAAELYMPAAGETLAVVGPSGAGKTLALKRLLDDHPGAREVAPLEVADLERPVLDLFDVDTSSECVLRTLARVGLADGRLWAMRAGQLSAGERRRLELALALVKPGTLVIDEFDAHLDSITARLLAQNLRRLTRDRPLVVTTHRPETLPYLQPARVIEIDRGVREIAPPPPVCGEPGTADMLDEITFKPGRARDYAAFARWHYLGAGRPGPTSDVWLAMHPSTGSTNSRQAGSGQARAVGIAMFGWPHLLLSARNETLPEYAPNRIRENGAGALNANVRLLQRVIVEPRYRGIGVARALIRHGLDQLDVSTVECVAQMGAFSGFLTAAGFKRAAELNPPRSVRRLVQFLREHDITADQLLRERNEIDRRLDEASRRALDARLRAVVRTRIETGFGCRRGAQGDHTELLNRVLSRLYARPAYFIWRRP